MKRVLFIVTLAGFNAAIGQVNIQSGANVIVQANTFMVVTGNLVTASNITGTGTIAMKGTTLQSLNLNNFTIPRLQINNAANVQLTGHARVANQLEFINGRVILGTRNLLLRTAATTIGASSTRYVETNSSGALVKSVSANLASFLMPVGSGGAYKPVTITSSATYAADALVAARSIPTTHPNKPAGASSYLNTYWKVTRIGVTGTVTSTALYTAANVVGTETALKSYFYNGSTFSLTGNSINTTTNVLTVNAPVSGDIVGMSTPPAGIMRPTDIGMEESIREPSVLPNPVINAATVTIPSGTAEMASLSVIDNSGKLTFQKSIYLLKGSNQHKIDMSGYASGTYQVLVKTGKGEKTFTVVKQ
ncbi:MAG TPA: T9SS type A sorting domain-containing protein [Flavitalea sp.]|nr:T9SS type A sorting domain-containing protein [Flavitalea sp.]